MPIKIRKMTEEEFQSFCQWSIKDHAKELMKDRQMSEADAFQAAKEELAGMLTYGLYTEDNDLMTIAKTEGEEVVGFVWILYEENNRCRQCFICDFAIWENWRRKGYGQKALQLAEKKAAEAGCREMVLFVSDDNTSATSLYRKCGYETLRRKDCGQYMIKQILL